MKMLVMGAGVIGSVYGAHVAAAGSKVSVGPVGTPGSFSPSPR
jgi:ketopantoate reductase